MNHQHRQHHRLLKDMEQSLRASSNYLSQNILTAEEGPVVFDNEYYGGSRSDNRNITSRHSSSSHNLAHKVNDVFNDDNLNEREFSERIRNERMMNELSVPQSSSRDFSTTANPKFSQFSTSQQTVESRSASQMQHTYTNFNDPSTSFSYSAADSKHEFASNKNDPAIPSNNGNVFNSTSLVSSANEGLNESNISRRAAVNDVTDHGQTRNYTTSTKFIANANKSKRSNHSSPAPPHSPTRSGTCNDIDELDNLLDDLSKVKKEVTKNIMADSTSYTQQNQVFKSDSRREGDFSEYDREGFPRSMANNQGYQNGHVIREVSPHGQSHSTYEKKEHHSEDGTSHFYSSSASHNFASTGGPRVIPPENDRPRSPSDQMQMPDNPLFVNNQVKAQSSNIYNNEINNSSINKSEYFSTKNTTSQQHRTDVECGATRPSRTSSRQRHHLEDTVKRRDEMIRRSPSTSRKIPIQTSNTYISRRDEPTPPPRNTKPLRYTDDEPDYKSPAPSVRSNSPPDGASLFSKYHSSHTHRSQQQSEMRNERTSATTQQVLNDAASPSVSPPPPRHVDQLMSEFSHSDSQAFYYTTTTTTQEEIVEDHRPRPMTPPSKPTPAIDAVDRGPAPRPISPPKIVPRVVPKPEEISHPPIVKPMAIEIKNDQVDACGPVQYASMQGHREASALREYREKGRSQDGKQGAAVIPICLPLCCAAPCVIM